MHLKSSLTESPHFKALQTQELNPEKSPLSQLVQRLTNRINSTNTNQFQTSTASHLNTKINPIIKQYKIHIRNIGIKKPKHKLNYNYIGP